MAILPLLYRSCYKISVLNLLPTPHALPLSWSNHFIRQQFTNKTINIELSESSEEQISISTFLPQPFYNRKMKLRKLLKYTCKDCNALLAREDKGVPLYLLLFVTMKAKMKKYLDQKGFLAFYFFRLLLFLLGYPAGASAEDRGFQPYPSSEERRKFSQGLFTSSTKPNLYTDVVLFFSSFFSSARKKKQKSIVFFPQHYPPALAVNKSPAVYFITRARRTLKRK